MKRYAWIRHYASCAAKSCVYTVPENEIDLLFVVPAMSKGWILDAICRELSAYYPKNSLVHYHEFGESLPAAHAYFFIHYNMLFEALSKQPSIWRSKRYVWYTHNSDHECGAKESEIPWVLNRMTKIFTTNTKVHQNLIKQGVSPNKLETLLGAADPELFRPHVRKGKTVGISTAYYDRKQPELMKAVVELMPDTNFILVGKDWDKWKNFKELIALPNLFYKTASYGEYPEIYDNFDVYLSTSELEGGPIPLIETMMCNVVPVVSDTGFCRDLISENENGYIFPTDASAEQVVSLIDKALNFDGDIGNSVAHLSWKNMSKNLCESVGRS